MTAGPSSHDLEDEQVDDPEEAASEPEPSHRSLVTTVRRWSGIVAMAVVAAMVGVAALRSSDPAPYRPQGRPLPLPEGGALVPVSRAEFDGILVGQEPKPVIVNVWASWCAPCRTEMPLLSRAAKTYAGKVTIIGLASRDDPGAAQAFLDDLRITYPNVFDTDGSVRVALGSSVFPTTYVFGADGRLLTKISGGISEQRLAAVIDDALR